MSLLRIFTTSAFLFCCLTSLALGAPPTEFLDIRWGANSTEVKRIMSQREGAEIKEESPTKLTYEGGTFASYPVERYELEFADGRFSRGTVYVEIPSGNGKGGVPLRNLQFEDLFKSLSTKYGKGDRSGGDGKHAQSDWKWSVGDPRSGQKRTVTIHLAYWWSPYEFFVRYSNEPASPPSSTPKSTKQRDL